MIFCFSGRCKEPLLHSKQHTNRMTPTGGRSRTGSESNPGATAAALIANEDCAEVTLIEDPADAGGRLPDLVAESRLYGVDEEPTESYLAITIQVFIPFLIAGLGMVGAGLVLDLVQVSSII